MLHEQEKNLLSLTLTNPWEDEYVAMDELNSNSVSTEEEVQTEQEDRIVLGLQQSRYVRDSMNYTLAHQPWEDSIIFIFVFQEFAGELAELKEIERQARSSRDEERKFKASRQRQFAQQMHIWKEKYKSPNNIGPSKLFILRAEREIVGFIYGGPSLLPDSEKNVVEVYAIHVLPTYAHYSYSYLLLWRAFSMWARFASWVCDGTEYRYTSGTAYCYEHHPVVKRLFAV